MNAPALEAGGDFTRAYVDRTNSLAPRENLALEINVWPTGQVTIAPGEHANNQDNLNLPLLAAADMIARCDIGYADTQARRDPNMGVIFRTKMYGNCLSALQRPEPFSGQAPAVKLVLAFWERSSLQKATMSGPEASSTFTGPKTEARAEDVETVRAHDLLASTEDVDQIRARSTSALTHMLKRDFGLQVSPADTTRLKIYSLWAITDRLQSVGLPVDPSSIVGKADFGRFVGECKQLEGKLGPGIKLESVLDPRCCDAYRRHKAIPGMVSLLLRDVVGPTPNPLPRRVRTMDDIRTAQQTGHLPSIRNSQSARAHQTKIPPFGSELAPVLQGREGDWMTVAREVDIITSAWEKECRRRNTRKANIEAAIYKDYPHLRPERMAALGNAETQYREMAFFPAYALGVLEEASMGLRQLSLQEQLAAYSAAVMGIPPEIRRANRSIDPATLRRTLLENIPVLTVPNINVALRRRAYGTDMEELSGLGIPQRGVGGYPLHLLIPQYMAVLDNSNSLFPIPSSLETAEPNDIRNAEAWGNIIRTLCHDTETRHRITTDDSAYRWLHGVKRTPVLHLFLACDLAERLETELPSNPQIPQIVALRFGDIFKAFKPEWVKRHLKSERLVQTFEYYHKLATT